MGKVMQKNTNTYGYIKIIKNICQYFYFTSTLGKIFWSSLNLMVLFKCPYWLMVNLIFVCFTYFNELINRLLEVVYFGLWIFRFMFRFRFLLRGFPHPFTQVITQLIGLTGWRRMDSLLTAGSLRPSSTYLHLAYFSGKHFWQ